MFRGYICFVPKSDARSASDKQVRRLQGELFRTGNDVVVTCIIALATVLVPGTVFGSFDDKGYRFFRAANPSMSGRIISAFGSGATHGGEHEYPTCMQHPDYRRIDGSCSASKSFDGSIE